MISGMSISIRLTTGFGGFMPSHSLVPVTAPRLGRDRHGPARLQAGVNTVL